MAPRSISSSRTVGARIPAALIVLASADGRRLHAFRPRRARSCIGGGSGTDDPATAALRARIKAALAGGSLPPLPGPRSWVGGGSGHPCHACGEALQGSELEHEVEIPGRPEPLRVHVKCYLIWESESAS